MNIESKDLYAALMHELKNNLGLLAMTIDGIPVTGMPAHDQSVDEARLLCQRVVDRLQQALLVYKAQNQPIVPMVDAYSPRDLADELRDTAASLARDRLEVEVRAAENVPAIWFLDRNLVEMALINAVHNSLGYAKSRISIYLAMEEGCLDISVLDDSDGYPEHVLQAFAARQPYRSTGTGLGLQFAQLVAEAHENRGRVGELRLSNQGGALFTLRLP
ncbi:MAG: sensor histidine kinase [Thiobacillus sp.]|nr:sensor histidine kinase [Thiobacillus sp.]